MGKWIISPRCIFLLIGLLLIIGLIQVLPQVDLPDTAFHEDTAPVVTKFRASSAPVLPVTVAAVHLNFFQLASESLWEPDGHLTHDGANFVPILLCSLRC
jgi:hypothetical protein